MKHIYTLLVLLYSFSIYAQVGIGTDSPDPSAQLEINAMDKGLLIPRVTLANRPGSPGKPAATAGLMIFQIDNDPGFYMYDGSSWEKMIKRSDLPQGKYFKAYQGTNTKIYILPPLPRSGWSVEYVPFTAYLGTNELVSHPYTNRFTINEAGTYHISYKLRPNYSDGVGIRSAIFIDSKEVEETLDIDNTSTTPVVSGECTVTIPANTLIQLGLRSSNASINIITIPSTAAGGYLSIIRLK